MKNSYIKTLGLAVALAAAAGALQGCSDDHESLTGEGYLSMTATVKSDIKVSKKSRAATEDELAEKAIVWISNSKGVVRKYNGLQTLPSEGIPLFSDHYIAEVWTGDSVSASFEHKYFKGREEFDITRGNVTRLQINCPIQNTVASVVYDEKVDELISDYKLTVGHKRGDLQFEGRDDRKGYFMMPSYDQNLKWNLEGTLANGTVYTRSGVIENAKRGTEYVIHITYNAGDDDPTSGGAYFEINVEENPIVFEDEFEITLAPQFEGYGYGLDEPVVGETGKFDRHSVMVYAVGELTSVVVESPLFAEIAGGTDVDLFNMSDQVRSAIQPYVTYTYSQDPEAGTSQCKVNFEENLLNLFEDGENAIMLRATDSYGKTTSATVTFLTSSASIVANEVDMLDVWATSATVTGRLLKNDVVNPQMLYRKAGESQWTAAATTVNGNTVSAQLTGLQPATAYEVNVACEGFEGKTAKRFTTEPAPQLPNASFEDWQTSSTPYLIYGSGQQMFWDSGNHGSATMSKNVTVPATDKKHSGAQSIKLCSQFVGVGSLGKFAAGNVFIGQYIETIGTNGVLGWGRPWTSRPKAVKGYVHYTPETVNYSSCDMIKKGDLDRGIIYVAILDGTMMQHGGKEYPVVVNTKDKIFFDKNDSKVIGYGELVLTEATAGEDMVEFTIPINYVRNAKAVNIMLTAAASQYGDYFSGGPSVMYLDDLELVY